MTEESVSKPRKLLGLCGKLAVRGLVGLFVLELLLRIGAFAWFGGSQYYLLYGLHGVVGRVSISPWSVSDGKYFKFPPNYTLEGAMGQADETARTNSLGFRGPDFEPEKPPGVFRVVCLGGSSTFGFHNTDSGTYPFLLQGLLNEARQDVEVINAGFPYYNSGSIRSLFTEELLAYEPDLITVYTGYNDTGRPTRISRFMRGLFWLQHHSMLFLTIKETILTDERVYQVRSKFQREDPRSQDRDAFETSCAVVTERFRNNLEALLDLAEERGIRAVLIKQAVSTSHKNEEYLGLTYAQECAALQTKLGVGDHMSDWEFGLLRHQRLMRELEALATSRGLQLVDNIALVDQNRTGLSSWVHLSEEANRRLAEALKEVVLGYLPPLGE